MNGLAGLIVPMSESKRDPNLDIFNAPEVASYYSSLNYLTPCERLLFDQYLSWGMTILDLGVGGGGKLHTFPRLPDGMWAQTMPPQ
jgi:hypothetical protein